ncbi:MAG: PaaI family thioesterase [Chloroflexi bacterium]|nr:PaaI family thioesterase [Chloroflexota bacterium]
MTTGKTDVKSSREVTNCFGCGQNNPIGLRLNISWDGEKAFTEFTPTKNHTGFDDIVHGGIICAVMDEIMSNVPFKQGVLTVTGKMEVRFRRPARPDVPLLVSAFLVKGGARILETRCIITLKDGTVMAEGKATMWVIERNGEAYINV